MTQLIYPQFYKQYGLRRLQSLLAPRLIRLTNLPRNSIVHYLTDVTTPEVDITKLYLKGYTKRIMIDFVDQLTGNKGLPRRRPLQVKNLVRDWILEHKQFKYLPEHYKIITDPLTLLMTNYNYLNDLYKYTLLPMTQYNKWWNVQDTLWSHINTIANNSSRNHFIFLNIPEELPGYTFLRIFSTKTTITMLKVFDTPDKLNLLELWKWLNTDSRELSVMNRLEPKNYNKINIVFMNKDNDSVIINLGYLNSWLEGNANTTEFETVIQIKPQQLQKVFLRFVMVAHGTPTEEAIPTDIIETPTDTVDQQEQQALKEENEEFLDEHSASEEESMNAEGSLAYLSKNSAGIKPGKLDDFKELESTDNDLKSNFADIDEELKVLDVLSNKKLLDKGIRVDDKGGEVEVTEFKDERTFEEIQTEALIPLTINESLKKIASEQADIGALTAVEYKNLLKDIEKYPLLKDPYGSQQTIEQAGKVEATDLELDTVKTTIEPIKTVLDNNMLQSSLLSFDSDYINNVLKKDILSMTAGVQKAGVIIRRHEVEIDNSALGAYENHTIELKPIRGASSILHFRLPKVEDDSTFVSGGNKYLLRKQRVDNPIRKISPNEVALTSYYGKTFVTRGAKKANSSLEWLLKQINLSIFDDNSFIHKVAPANVFDNNVKVPYIYAGLSNYYKSFIAGTNYLIFDYQNRASLLGRDENELVNIETEQYVAVGLTETNQLIVVNFNDQFFIYANDTYTPIGNIYTLLQLQQKAAPVDFTEIRVFNKSIPTGLFISYFIGLSGLIKLLNVKHQVVDTKPRILKPDEYTLTFKDVVYIFSRDDIVASMLLGGFTTFTKQLKTYTFAEFNQKDVYFNLLREKGLTSIYIRELELTNQLFIDPITEGILKDMKEPTTFIGLLIRSTEMLRTYHHPDSQDLSVMRIRGYERLSGVIYKELVGSLRQFNNRNISGKSKLEMSPYKIWQTVMEDASVKLVEDINPIQNLKELEVVTYVGEGGRNKDSMNKKSRAYHPDDMGVISESTVDSSDVGINSYLSANPNFKNLRGIIKPSKVLNTTTMLSTSANLAPGSTNDD